MVFVLCIPHLRKQQHWPHMLQLSSGSRLCPALHETGHPLRRNARDIHAVLHMEKALLYRACPSKQPTCVSPALFAFPFYVYAVHLLAAQQQQESVVMHSYARALLRVVKAGASRARHLMKPMRGSAVCALACHKARERVRHVDQDVCPAAVVRDDGSRMRCSCWATVPVCTGHLHPLTRQNPMHSRHALQ